MKRVALGALLAGANLQALAHDGHGVDPASLLHYLSGAHVLVPLSIGLSVAACAVAVRAVRNRR